MIHQDSTIRRKLAVHVVSVANGGAGLVENNYTKTDVNLKISAPTKVTDIVEFKASQSLYPLVKPFNDIPRKGQRSKL